MTMVSSSGKGRPFLLVEAATYWHSMWSLILSKAMLVEIQCHPINDVLGHHIPCHVSTRITRYHDIEVLEG